MGCRLVGNPQRSIKPSIGCGRVRRDASARTARRGLGAATPRAMPRAMLHLNDVSLRVGGELLLEHASVRLPAGHRVGLVGRNGSGKTSLLRLILGELSPDAGEISLRRGARIGWVAQEAPGGQASPRAAVLAADRERARLLAEAEQAHDAAAHRRDPDPARRHRRPSRHRPAPRAILARPGLRRGRPAPAAVRASPAAGGCASRSPPRCSPSPTSCCSTSRPTTSTSRPRSGSRTTCARYPRTLLLVSHDRDLLNKVPSSTSSISSSGKLTLYTGGYDTFERSAPREAGAAAREASAQAGSASASTCRPSSTASATRLSKARQAQSRLKTLARHASRSPR